MDGESSSRRRFLMLCASLALEPASRAIAMETAGRYPDHSIRFICPFPPGGSVDISTRLIAKGLSSALGQPVVVDNRSGSSGIIGTEVAARAQPDGYTMVMGSSSTFGVNPTLYSHLSYDAIKDFAPVSMVSFAPNVLVVNPSVQAHSVKELVQLAKEKPGQLSFASSGFGGAPHLAGELFKMDAHINIAHIPYRGTGQAITDLVAGQVQMSFGTALALLPFIKSGQLRPLAVTSERRISALPDVPTMGEAGFPGVVVTSWNGVLVPAGTPPAIILKLNAAIRQMVDVPAFKTQFESLGAVPDTDTPEQFQAYIRNEISKWGKVVKAAGLQIN